MLRTLKILFFLLFFANSVSAQSGLYLSMETGLGFNNNLALNDIEITNSVASFTDLHSSFQFKIYRNIYSEVGLGGRFILARGSLGENSFRARTSRIILPILVGIEINEKWKLAGGVNIQNNKDVVEIDLRENYFWRANSIIKGQYAFKEKWFFNLTLSHNFQGLGDTFLINDPKTMISVGVSRKL